MAAFPPDIWGKRNSAPAKWLWGSSGQVDCRDQPGGVELNGRKRVGGGKRLRFKLGSRLLVDTARGLWAMWRAGGYRDGGRHRAGAFHNTVILFTHHIYPPPTIFQALTRGLIHGISKLGVFQRFHSEELGRDAVCRGVAGVLPHECLRADRKGAF